MNINSNGTVTIDYFQKKGKQSIWFTNQGQQIDQINFCKRVICPPIKIRLKDIEIWNCTGKTG